MKEKGWSRKVHWRIKSIKKGRGDENVHCSWIKSSLLSVALNEMKLCIIMMLLLCLSSFTPSLPHIVVIVMWFRSFSILQSSVNAFNIMRMCDMWIRDGNHRDFFAFRLIQMRHMRWHRVLLPCNDMRLNFTLDLHICMSGVSKESNITQWALIARKYSPSSHH